MRLSRGLTALLFATLGAAAWPSMADSLVVIVHPSAPALTRSQIEAIYLGRSALLRPLDLPTMDMNNDQFYRRLTGRDPAYARSAWAAVVFTGRGRPPQVMQDSEAVVRRVAADPGAIGYIEAKHLDSRIRAALVLE